MHAGSLQIRRLTSSGGTCTACRTHPLGNINQFHSVLSDPEVLDLTRHETTCFRPRPPCGRSGSRQNTSRDPRRPQDGWTGCRVPLQILSTGSGIHPLRHSENLHGLYPSHGLPAFAFALHGRQRWRPCTTCWIAKMQPDWTPLDFNASPAAQSRRIRRCQNGPRPRRPVRAPRSLSVRIAHRQYAPG